MFGAIVGDITGSLYENFNIDFCLEEKDMITQRSRFTDDSVMTCAVAEGISNGLRQLPENWLEAENYETVLCSEIVKSLKRLGREYPNAGYGYRFWKWLRSEESQPYNSFGNGSAMRVAYAGWIARSLEEAEKLAELSAKVTHNHPEGIKGAVVTAGSIYILRQGGGKEAVRDYVKANYDIDFTLDQIRKDYTFDVTCQGSVPQSIVAFLEGESYVDVIARAISIGGDSDTIAAIAGSLAEVVYRIPAELHQRALDKLDDHLRGVIESAMDYQSAYTGN